MLKVCNHRDKSSVQSTKRMWTELHCHILYQNVGWRKVMHWGCEELNICRDKTVCIWSRITQIEEVAVLHDKMQLMRHYNSRWKVDFFFVWIQKKCIQTFSRETWREEIASDISIDGGIILKWFLGKYRVSILLCPWSWVLYHTGGLHMSGIWSSSRCF